MNLPSIESDSDTATTTAVEGSMRYRMGIKDDNNQISWVYGEWSEILTVGAALVLEVGKGYITPNIDLEEGDTLSGSATVLNAVNPVEVHVWELDGSEDQRGSSATYVAKAGVVRYRKEVTDDNNQSPVIGEWSDPVTVAEVIDDTVPNATMYGLRFDPARQTKLINSAIVDNSSIATYSFWIKPLKNEDSRGILGTKLVSGGGTINTNAINLQNLRIAVSEDGVAFLRSPDTLNLKIWNHVVVNTSKTVAADNKIFINGTEVSSYELQNTGELRLDGYCIGESKNGRAEMYLSDLFVVDGQALEPEVFGKYFGDPGKWGPLDSSDVKTNIAGGVKSPSDSCPNYSVKWSDSLTTSGIWYTGRGPEMAFNGVVERANGAATGDGQVLTFDPKITIPENSVIEVDCGTSSADWNITVDGVPGQIIPEGMGFTSITYNNGTTFPKLEIKSTDPVPSADLIAIRLNGRLLIDGPADNSQVWSEGLFKGRQQT